MNGYPNKEVVEELRTKYKAGHVIILDKMIDEQAPEIGTAGVVTSVDDIGTIHVDWLTESTLGVVYPVDEVHIATPHETALYYINKDAKEQHDGSYCPRCGDEMPGSPSYTCCVQKSKYHSLRSVWCKGEP